MKKIFTGIDLGSYGIKMIVCECVNGAFHVLAATNVKSKGIKEGRIVDREQALISLKKAKENMEGLLGTTVNQAIVSVPSDEIEFNIVSGEIVLEEKNLVDEEQISSVLQEAVLGKISEDRELITVMPIAFSVDGKEGVKDPKGLKGEKLSVKAVITSIPKVSLKETVSLLKEADIVAVDVSFKALGDYYEARNNDVDGAVSAIVNIGYDNIDVAIFNKGIMIKNEKIITGSREIDQEIMRRYYLKKGVARALKENFAISNTRYADASDTIEVTNREGEKITIGQLEISELVESKLVELLKLAKKQINLLTKREISYIIITGGISEMAGFQYVVENIFDRRAMTLDIRTMGARNNMYSSALGMVKYFYYKLELRGKEYSMFNENQESEIISTNRKVSATKDSILHRVFEYFS